MLASRIHQLKNAKGETAVFGPNPFEAIWVEVLDGGAKGQLWEHDYATQKWSRSLDYPNTFSTRGLPCGLTGSVYVSNLFKITDYINDDGYSKLGDWIEAAVKQAGR